MIFRLKTKEGEGCLMEINLETKIIVERKLAKKEYLKNCLKTIVCPLCGYRLEKKICISGSFFTLYNYECLGCSFLAKSLKCLI